MNDFLIKDALIIDGSGSPWFVADVAVAKGQITAIGKELQVEAKEVIDAKGKVLSPGFIDIHSHSDFSLPIEGCGDSRLLQGVTTEIGGNCGLSPAPVVPERLDLLKKYTGFLTQDLSWNWNSFSEYLKALEAAQPAVNFGCLVGHGTLRVAAMGFDERKPTEEELALMKKLLKESMEQGAFGFSSGLIYPPGCYSDTAELAEIAAAVAPFGGYYETHMRNEGDDILASIDESAEVGKKAKVAVQIAHHKVVGRHNWGNALASQARIAHYREEGVDMVCDQYPYIASSTTITTIFPQWAHEGGVDGLLTRLKDPEFSAMVKKEVVANMAKSSRRFEDILIASVATEKNKHLEGLTVAEAAALVDEEPCDFACKLVIEEKASVAVVFFGMAEEDVKHIMAHPLTMIGSDGLAMPMQGPGKPHPRTFGTFVRVLAKYALGEKLFSLEEGIRKMTSMPAARAGLHDRGLIKPNFAADLVLFDPQELADVATFAEPRQAPKGIEKVWVNGVLAVKDGKVTGNRAGQVLRNR